MKIACDAEVDALYITLKGHGVDHTVPVGPDLAIEYGPGGEVHGIEILSASRHVNLRPDRPDIELQGVGVAGPPAAAGNP
jgi:uncharacterized protein YuzE